MACTKTYCGDGIVQNPNGNGVSEVCDDGNMIAGDGCYSCQLEVTAEDNSVIERIIEKQVIIDNTVTQPAVQAPVQRIIEPVSLPATGSRLLSCEMVK